MSDAPEIEAPLPDAPETQAPLPDAPETQAPEARDSLPLLAGDTSFTVHLRWLVAFCSVAAGLLHYQSAFAHIDHHILLGEAFFASAVLQVVWAVWIVRAPSRNILLLGGVGTLAAIVLWVFAHSTGVSWFPGLETAEIIGWRDTTVKLFELMIVLGVAALLLPAAVHRPTEPGKLNSRAIALFAVAVLGVLGINYVGTYGQGHIEGGDHTHGPAEVDTTSADHHG